MHLNDCKETKMETPKSVQEYIELIDSKFQESKRDRISRYDLRWGKWSREMNLEIRKKIETYKDKFEITMLKSILPYWLVTSELLELHFKSKVSGLSKKKKLSKDRQNIRNDILGGKATSEMSIKDLAVRALRGS